MPTKAQVLKLARKKARYATIMATNEPDNSLNPIVLDLCRVMGIMMVHIEENVPDPTLADILTQLYGPAIWK